MQQPDSAICQHCPSRDACNVTSTAFLPEVLDCFLIADHFLTQEKALATLEAALKAGEDVEQNVESQLVGCPRCQTLDSDAITLHHWTSTTMDLNGPELAEVLVIGCSKCQGSWRRPASDQESVDNAFPPEPAEPFATCPTQTESHLY